MRLLIGGERIMKKKLRMILMIMMLGSIILGWRRRRGWMMRKLGIYMSGLLLMSHQ
jgi:hypothetical protein